MKIRLAGGVGLESPPRILVGLALAFGGYCLFALQDAGVKWLVQSYAVPEILCLRSGTIVAVTLAAGQGGVVRAIAASSNKRALLARGVLILAAWMLFYSASAHLGLAEITTLYFAAPVIAVVLSALVLKERVGLFRWGTVAAGFAGVLVAAGPLGALAPWPATAALLAAACWGTSTILVRWIGRTDGTLGTVLSSNAIFTLGCLPLLPWTWHAPERMDLALMIGLGLIGGLGQYLLFESFRHAPASAIAPIEYTGLIWAGLYGYAIWGDVPGPTTVAGAAMIVAASIGLVVTERRRARRRLRAEPSQA